MSTFLSVSPMLAIMGTSGPLSLAEADTGVVARDVAERSILIKNMMDDIGDQAMTEAVPIPNVSFPSLPLPNHGKC